jgi:hypothetical protein
LFSVVNPLIAGARYNHHKKGDFTCWQGAVNLKRSWYFELVKAFFWLRDDMRLNIFIILFNLYSYYISSP